MASSSSYASLPLPMLTTKNYDSWRIKMQAFLQGQGVSDLVLTGYTKPDATAVVDMIVAQRTKYEESKKKKVEPRFLL